MGDAIKRKGKSLLYFLVMNIVGCGIYAFGVQFFTAPYHIAPGGVIGIATLTNYLWSWPIGTVSLVINIPLLLLSGLQISKEFTIRTTISTVMLSVCTDVMAFIVGVVSPYSSTSPLGPLFASVFGGVLMGIGNALVYMVNSTTGGTAIISALLQKRFPQISMGKLLMGTNLLVVILAAFVYKSIDSAILAVITIFVSTVVMDNMVYGVNTNRLAFIISDKSAEIEEKILVDMHRGVTILKGEGGYRHSQKNIIFCVVSKSQFYKLRDLIVQIDDRAFIVGCSAGDVLGKGFKHLD